MRGVFWALAVLALTSGGAGAASVDFALADSSNLAGGVLIAHHPAAMVYSVDTPGEGWCANYQANHAITSAADQVNRIDTTANGTFWFVLAAWGEPKKFCGAEFGLGTYDPSAFGIVGSGPCGTGTLEIPNGGWPGPGGGVGIATTTVPFRGNFVPIYYFAGYAYDAVPAGTVIPIVHNPATDFAGTANCETPSVPFNADCLGAMGIFQAGVHCDPILNPPGACCFGGGTCQIVADQAACEALGGSWNGGGSCDPTPCPITWACCVHDESSLVETCLMLTQTECTQVGGIWHQTSECATFTCPLLRACCIASTCVGILTLEECTNTYSGNWIADQPACLCPTPAEQTSWGTIKAIYR
jgi:hypothetical protein